MDNKLKEINKDNVQSFDKELVRIAILLNSFDKVYPDIETWFQKKVFPGLQSGERSILFISNNVEIIALAILKDSLLEKKICTFYISPNARGKGFANILFNRSFEKLKTRTPLISVPENTLNHFSKYLQLYKFKQTGYRFLKNLGMREFEFNGSWT